MKKQIQYIRIAIKRALSTFSFAEKIIFVCAILLCIIAISRIIYNINEHFLIEIPDQGGTLTEGMVGVPRYINPLLAVSQADYDISRLVYRGLMKEDANGNIVPDLAKSYTVSPDNLTYTFQLGKNYFQDGKPITANDVLFTINSAQNATLNSPEMVKWVGVNVQAIDQNTVSFTLKTPYAPFLQNATIGILPEHIWKNIAYNNWSYSKENTQNTIGSGWFKVTNISQNSSGIPDSYNLSAYRKDGNGSPMIDTITVKFYASENDMINAFNSGDIDTMGGIDPENTHSLLQKGATIITTPLPRIFGLFFNQSQADFFTDTKVRQAISLAINKNAIVNDVLDGYGETINSPVPANLYADTNQSSTFDIAKAKSLLEKDGWKLGNDGIYTKNISKKKSERLSFEIDTSNTPELKQSIDHIVSDLKQAGIEAIPKVYETGSLNQDIIRPRKFQTLFFGQVVSNQADLFAFWDSSQINSPGLNIAGYANSAVDKLLEQGKGTLDQNSMDTIYQKFSQEINNDIPAVFIYSPSYIYVVRNTISQGIYLPKIIRPEDRFDVINTWYIETDHVWKIFAKK